MRVTPVGWCCFTRGGGLVHDSRIIHEFINVEHDDMTWSAGTASTQLEDHWGRRVRCFIDRPCSIDALLARAVARNPAADAMVDESGERVSYRALDARVSQLAAGLADAGVGPGDRVAFAIGNRFEFLELLLATIRAGAIAVPLNVREQRTGLRYVLEHSGATVLASQASLAPRIPTKASLPHLTERLVILDDPDYRLADSERPFDALRTSRPQMLKEPQGLHDLEKPNASQRPHTPHEEDVAIILYTSGTTGQPKGAMLTHFNVIHSVMHYEICMGLSAQERSVLAAPASHVTGLVANLLTMVAVGGANVFLPVFKARRFIGLAARERMTHTVMVPAMYNLCLREPVLDQIALAAWRIGGYGGAPMPPATITELAARLPALGLANLYGSTETTSPTTAMPVNDTARFPDSVGQLVPCAHARVVDDDGRDVLPGERGELLVAGPMVVPGYWRDAATTEASFANEYWRSGDIVSMDETGFVRIFDRKKDLINRGGFKIYSIEVEHALTAHPDVLDCAVVAHPDPILGEKVHAFVQTADPGLSAQSLNEFCARQLADYKVPELYTFASEPLPRNANGKVLKAKLRESHST